jgi:DNA-binding response OmpR family regulator
MCPVSSARGRGRRLLIVEDDRELSDLLVHALGQAGYEVVAAQSAHEAMAAVATASPAAIVLTAPHRG